MKRVEPFDPTWDTTFSVKLVAVECQDQDQDALAVMSIEYVLSCGIELVR